MYYKDNDEIEEDVAVFSFFIYCLLSFLYSYVSFIYL